MIGDEFADRLLTFGFRLCGHTLNRALMLASRLVIDLVKNNHEGRGGTTTINHLSQGQKAAIQGIEVPQERLAEFDRFARKYGLQYSVIQEENDPQTFFLTFRQRDINRLEMAVTDMMKDKTRSWEDLPELMKQAKEKAFSVQQPDKATEKTAERTAEKAAERTAENSVQAVENAVRKGREVVLER